jgi:hypothetical protein
VCLDASQQAGMDENDFNLKQELVRQVKFQVPLHLQRVMNEDRTQPYVLALDFIGPIEFFTT